jgi:tetratricopeptide (TPR) repeat protein
VVRYRFQVQPAVGTPPADPMAGLTALEQRVAASAQPSALDLGELADFYLRRAMLNADPRDYDKAEETAKRSLAVLPDPNGSIMTIAKIATARHDFTKAIEIATDYAKHGSGTGAFQILATSYLAIGELDKAAEAAELMSAKPSTGASFTRALVEQAQGRDSEAEFDFEHAVALEENGDLPESARLRTLWGRFLLRRGDAAGAKLCLDEAVRIVPDYPLAVANQGELALRTGHPQEAKALFEKAFVSTRLVRYLIDEARAQEAGGDRDAADRTRTQVEKLVRAELAAGGFGHAMELVEVLVDRGQPADLVEAISVGREEIERRGSAEVKFQVARAYARSNKRFEGLPLIHAALASGAREARFYELASKLEAMDGNAPRAAMYEKEAVALDPGGTGWRTIGMAPR